ncbi:MAG: AraC family transcriptional regulator [Erythrobacter sp.]|nr:AraC family transcriptional regulator [Erythrobacter sp.]
MTQQTGRVYQATPIGFEWHDGANRIDRHCHREGYVTIVLSGAYSEAGDNGRRRLEPGDVVVHSPFETHANLIGSKGVRLFSVAMPTMASSPIRNGRISKPDDIVGFAERDPQGIASILSNAIEPIVILENDWPDRLAQALTTNWNLSITRWARSHRLAPETVSRGFRAAYGVSPKRFRAQARARVAWTALVGGTPQADVVHNLRFSDQSHLCREIVNLTGATPGAWQVK